MLMNKRQIYAGSKQDQARLFCQNTISRSPRMKIQVKSLLVL